MRHVTAFILIGIALVLSGCSSAKSSVAAGYDLRELNTLAIADIRGNVQGEAALDQVGHFFAVGLLERGYSLVERRSVKALLDEQDFQFSDLTSRRNMSRAGEILNAQAILNAVVTRSGEKMAVSAEAVDVETGRVIWAASTTGDRKETLFTVVGGAIGGLIGWAAGGDDEGEIAGGVAGGATGGVIGRSLSPSEQKLARKLIVKICRRFPRLPGRRR